MSLTELFPDVNWEFGYGQLPFVKDQYCPSSPISGHRYCPIEDLTISLYQGPSEWSATMYLGRDRLQYHNKDPNYILAKLFTNIYSISNELYNQVRGPYSPVQQDSELFGNLGRFDPYRAPGGEVRSWIQMSPYFTATIYESICDHELSFLTLSNLPESVRKISNLKFEDFKGKPAILFKHGSTFALIAKASNYLVSMWRAGQDLHGFFQSSRPQGKQIHWADRLGCVLTDD